MWVATVLAVVGLLGVAAITQVTGYRLGGSITVPVLAVYTLKNFLMLPVFLLSAVAAYIGLWVLRRQTLIFGRDELVAAIVIGTTVPVAALLLALQLGLNVGVIAFLGSILPGLAAYNYHQIKPEHRRADLQTGLMLFGGLIALGWLLINPETARRFGTSTPPVLFSQTADIATFKDVAVALSPDPVLIPRSVIAGLFAGGFVLSERLRSRFGVRIGIIGAVLLAVYALASYWLLVLYAALALLSFTFIQVTNYLTLRYGRVLLGVTVAAALLVAILATQWLPLERGLSVFFTAILAGVTAYNAHASPPLERRLVVPLQIVVFVPALLIARLTVAPQPHGLLQQPTGAHVLVLIALWTCSLGVALWYVASPPEQRDVLAMSVLSEGDRQ
jgi:hypothetical protein